MFCVGFITKRDFLSVVANGLSAELLVSYVATVEDRKSIAEGAFNAPTEGVTFKRAPITLTLNAVGRERPRHVGANHYDISLIAFA